MPPMPATVINPLITNAGFNAAQAQSGLGLQLAITHVQLGSAAYVLDPTSGSADYNRTSLVTPKETVAIAAGHVMDKGFRVDAQFPAWTLAAYGAMEIGFWAGDPAAGGVLFAIWAQATAFTQRNNIDYLASFAVGLARVPTGSVTVSFDPDLQKAIALVTYHEQAANPHPQYKKDHVLWVAEYAPGSGDPLQILNSDIGGLVTTVAATAIMPPASVAETGDRLTVIAHGTVLSVQRNGTENFIFAGTSATAISLKHGEFVEFTKSNSGSWLVSGGAPLAPKLTGTYCYSSGTTPPPGTIKANGAILSRTTYAALWAWAQASGNLAASDAAWGAGAFGSFSPGDGSTTFRIPDLRAHTLRGADDGRGTVVGFNVGSVQADQLLAHAHGINDPGHGHAVSDPGHAHNIQHPSDSATSGANLSGNGNPVAQNFATDYSGTGIGIYGSGTGISIQNSAGGTEVRVKAVGALPCIYY
jgi:microcystin-dependent protein